MNDLHLHLFLIPCLTRGTQLQTLLRTFLDKSLGGRSFLLRCIPIQEFIALLFLLFSLFSSGCKGSRCVNLLVHTFSLIHSLLKSIVDTHSVADVPRFPFELKVVKGIDLSELRHLVVIKVDQRLDERRVRLFHGLVSVPYELWVFLLSLLRLLLRWKPWLLLVVMIEVLGIPTVFYFRDIW